MEATAGSAAPARVYCPRCGRPTDHIQSYQYPVVMFAVVYFAWSSEGQRVVGCPPCARQQLRAHALLSLVMANVLCFIPLSVILANLQLSLDDTRPHIPPEYYHLANLPPDENARAREAKARRTRLLVVLFILAAVGACLVFLLPRLAG